jgi:hypothetical protein
MSDYINYIHFGNSLKQSLTDYGMVCRKERSDQYYFIYKVNEKYEEGFISETDIEDFMNSESGYSENEIRDFLHKTDEKSYLNFMELPILEKVYKLSSHFGVETILGKAIQGLTLASAVGILETE